MSFHAMKLLIEEAIEELEGLSAKSFEGGDAREIKIALGGTVTFKRTDCSSCGTGHSDISIFTSSRPTTSCATKASSSASAII